MGFMNNVKGSMAAKDAAEAHARGDSIFAFKAIEANSKSTSTGAMPGIAEQIQSIEAAGWHLDHMAAAESKTMTGERIALVLLFRRR